MAGSGQARITVFATAAAVEYLQQTAARHRAAVALVLIDHGNRYGAFSQSAYQLVEQAVGRYCLDRLKGIAKHRLARTADSARDRKSVVEGKGASVGVR